MVNVCSGDFRGIFEKCLNVQLQLYEKSKELNKRNSYVGAKLIRDAVPLYDTAS
jgi:hypothetical protein